MTDWALDKPHGFYLSSFRCVSAFVAQQVVSYAGPYPYVDGLLLQVTQRIGSITVRHDARTAGASGYTLRRLIRLWLSAWLNFSILPLRVATLVGLFTAFGGLLRFAGRRRAVAAGARSRLRVGMGDGRRADLLRHAARDARADRRVLGRMFLTVNQRPQAVVREVTDFARCPAARGVTPVE